LPWLRREFASGRNYSTRHDSTGGLMVPFHTAVSKAVATAALGPQRSILLRAALNFRHESASRRAQDLPLEVTHSRDGVGVGWTA